MPFDARRKSPPPAAIPPNSVFSLMLSQLPSLRNLTPPRQNPLSLWYVLSSLIAQSGSRGYAGRDFRRSLERLASFSSSSMPMRVCSEPFFAWGCAITGEYGWGLSTVSSAMTGSESRLLRRPEDEVMLPVLDMTDVRVSAGLRLGIASKSSIG